MDKVKCPKCHWVNTGGRDSCEKCRTALPRVRVSTSDRADSKQRVLKRDQVFAQRYTVREVLGQGGMGCIYRALDNTLKEEVALKTLLPQYAEDRDIVDRFRNEARIARALSHPHIGRVHDIGMAQPEGVLYISMELIQGQSLRSMLDGLPPGERLPIRVTLRLLDELCTALGYAHEFTVHRDIKPENVMVDGEGTVKLMDFGISKLKSNTQLTATSVIMGTPQYMSPEQHKDSKNVDGRADVYSIGVMLYEIVTGQIPTGMLRPASQIRKDVPPALDPIIQKCVESNPDDRYQNMTELRAALAGIREVVTRGTVQTAAKAKRERAEIPVRKIGGIAAALGIVALTGVALAELEQRRRAMLADRSPVVLQVPAASATEADRWEALNHRHKRALYVGDRIASDRGGWDDVIEMGQDRWQQAQRATGVDSEDAMRLGIEAIQCYLAPVVYEEFLNEHDDMVFIPPGTAEIEGQAVPVGAFFIDRTEVTQEQFAEFSQSVEGGWSELPMLPAANLPISRVAFHDAYAYALWAQKNLPTEAQWVRAAYGEPPGVEEAPAGEDDAVEEPAIGLLNPAPVNSNELDLSPLGCADMYGNVSEWTRTRPSLLDPGEESIVDRIDEQMFGSLIYVRGGNFQRAEDQRFTNAFELRAPTVGFRCVVELPNTFEDIDKWLE
jgi:formylglycine-generating enzyme required for sulfatase activity